MEKCQEFVGEKYGRLLVLKIDEAEYPPIAECLCDCGKTRFIDLRRLKNGHTRSCGCSRLKNDLTGRRFGRLVVIRKYKSGLHSPLWLCQCDCGNVSFVETSNLIRNGTKSCGCLKREKEERASKERESAHNRGVARKRLATIKRNNKRLFNIWSNMLSRCSENGHKDYGKRGIRICDEWKHSFVKFKNWAIKNGYSDSLTIERIDVNGNYAPENCKWIPANEQSSNRRCCIKVEINGNVYNTKQLSELVGVSMGRIATIYREGRIMEYLSKKGIC